MSDAEQELMTSGVFSRRSRLSAKALRLYEGMGLLEPLFVDPSNGYRYYGDRQLEPARLIGLLRRLDMPLATIREVVALDANEAVSALGVYWQDVESAHLTRRELMRYVLDRLAGRGNDMFDIEVRETPEQRIASVEKRVLANDLPDFIEEGMGTVYQLLGAQGVTTGIPFVIYHGEVNLDADGPVEVCVPYEGSVEPTGAVRVRVEPGHAEAFTRISKEQVEFPRILDAYAAVEAWMKEHGHAMAGSPREVYFADFSVLGPTDPACDIAFPMRAS